jgi:hypothetical protein
MQEANPQTTIAHIVETLLNSNEIEIKEFVRNASMLEEEMKRAKLAKMSLISPFHLSQTLYDHLNLKRKLTLLCLKAYSSLQLYQLTQILVWQLTRWLRDHQCVAVKSVELAMISHHLSGGTVYVLADQRKR